MLNSHSIKVLAFDLDGTLTQHKEKLSEQHKNTLDLLSEKYQLLMVGAGTCQRIFDQMGKYPISIIGNYGMQYSVYQNGELKEVYSATQSVNKELIESRVSKLREKFGFKDYTGESVEYHPSGCLTFPILGTKALQKDKLAFDPDRSRRRAIYQDVKNSFPEYTVFVGGSSSFDFAPKPYNKAYALEKWCANNRYSHNEVVYFGDDYGLGGNDEAVYLSEFSFVPIDNYNDFSELSLNFLK